MNIRAETKADHEAVHEVNTQAFGRENEARLIENIRSSAGYIPELSLVAVQDHQIIGHILFSPIIIETPLEQIPALALAPMAVLPAYQNQGIGSALIRHGLSECQRLQHPIVVVLGHASYYPRFGFVSAREYGIVAPFPVPDEVFMILELSPRALSGKRGTVKYPPAFDTV